MKSRHVAGTITKKKKNLVLEVVRGMPAWPGRHLLEGGEHQRYFGLKTVLCGLVEFECRNQREYEIWTEGVSRLLSLAAGRIISQLKCWVNWTSEMFPLSFMDLLTKKEESSTQSEESSATSSQTAKEISGLGIQRRDHFPFSQTRDRQTWFKQKA